MAHEKRLLALGSGKRMANKSGENKRCHCFGGQISGVGSVGQTSKPESGQRNVSCDRPSCDFLMSLRVRASDPKLGSIARTMDVNWTHISSSGGTCWPCARPLD